MPWPSSGVETGAVRALVVDVSRSLLNVRTQLHRNGPTEPHSAYRLERRLCGVGPDGVT